MLHIYSILRTLHFSLQWRSADGTQVEGFLYFHQPLGDTDAPPQHKDAPLVVHAHGGPAIAKPLVRADAAGATRYPFRHLLAAGYRVLMPNFRGTLGYGDEFASANIGQQVGSCAGPKWGGCTAGAQRGEGALRLEPLLSATHYLCAAAV